MSIQISDQALLQSQLPLVTSLADNSDTNVPSQKAVKTAIDNLGTSLLDLSSFPHGVAIVAPSTVTPPIEIVSGDIKVVIPINGLTGTLTSVVGGDAPADGVPGPDSSFTDANFTGSPVALATTLTASGGSTTFPYGTNGGTGTINLTTSSYASALTSVGAFNSGQITLNGFQDITGPNITASASDMGHDYSAYIVLNAWPNLTSVGTIGITGYGYGYGTGYVAITNCPNLTTIGAVTAILSGYGAITLFLNGNALDSTIIDTLAASLVAQNPTNGTGLTVDISGGTNAVPSPAAAANFAILISNGANITTN